MWMSSRQKQVCNYNINIDISIQNLHEGILTPGFPFLQSIVNGSNIRSTGFLIFVCSYTIAIIPSYNRNGQLNAYFLFDSHSRDSRGITNIIGYSVLMKFSDLLEIERYLEVAYEVANRFYPIYFQL